MIKNKTLRVVRRRRAAMLLWYMLVAFPMLVLCGVISLEYQRILSGARVAQVLADTSAKYSVDQVLDPETATSADYAAQGCGDGEPACLIKGGVPVGGRLSVNQAVQRFVKSYTDGVNANEGGVYITVTSVKVTEIRQLAWKDAGQTQAIPPQVTVEISYKVPSVGFLGLGRLIGADVTESTYVAKSYAQICFPGSGETVTKNCVETKAS